MLARTVANVKGSAVQNLCKTRTRSAPLSSTSGRAGRSREREEDAPAPRPRPARHPRRLARELPVLSDLGRVRPRVGVVVAVCGAERHRVSARSSTFSSCRPCTSSGTLARLRPPIERRRRAKVQKRGSEDALPEDGADAARDGVGELARDLRVRVVVARELVVLGGQAEEHWRAARGSRVSRRGGRRKGGRARVRVRAARRRGSRRRGTRVSMSLERRREERRKE